MVRAFREAADRIALAPRQFPRLIRGRKVPGPDAWNDDEQNEPDEPDELDEPGGRLLSRDASPENGSCFCSSSSSRSSSSSVFKSFARDRTRSFPRCDETRTTCDRALAPRQFPRLIRGRKVPGPDAWNDDEQNELDELDELDESGGRLLSRDASPENGFCFLFVFVRPVRPVRPVRQFSNRSHATACGVFRGAMKPEPHAIAVGIRSHATARGVVRGALKPDRPEIAVGIAILSACFASAPLAAG